MTRWQERTGVFLGALLALLAFLAVAQAQEASEEAATLGMSTSEHYGDFLVDADGLTLYLLTADSEGMSTCVGDCAAAWPPLLTDGDPMAGEGLDAELLGTIEREDGTMQVTYNGHPLYLFVQDEEPGDTAGQDLDGPDGKWYLITPAGEPIETAAASENDADDAASEAADDTTDDAADDDASDDADDADEEDGNGD